MGYRDKPSYIKNKAKRIKHKQKKKRSYNEWRKYNNIKIPKWVKVEVRKRDIDTCQYCGKICTSKKIEQGITPEEDFLFDMLTFDHMLSRSQGGDNSPDNIVVACYPCNYEKNDMSISEWEEKIKKAE